MARATMATLITFVRRKIGDPAGASQVFSDDDIQAELDSVRLDVIPPEVLIPAYTIAGGTYGWLDFYSSYPFWEDGATLYDVGWNIITASATEPLREPDDTGKAAHFQFAATQFAVRAQGHSFDVWAASANLLEDRITSQALNLVNINLQGANIALNQTIQTWEKRVAEYRARQRIRMISATRADTMSRAEWQRKQTIGIVSADVPFIDGR